MLRSFIQMTALILTLGASLFLMKSNFGLTPDLISKLSATNWNYNPLVVRSFATQSADTRVGAYLLFSAFVLQLVNSLWPLRWSDFDIDWHGTLISIGVSIILLTSAHWYSKNLAERIHNETLQKLEEKK